MTNPLVAQREDSTQAFSGVQIAESVTDTQKAIESGDWAAGVMGAVGTGLDALGMALDPFGAILSAGVGWLMEHIGPVSDALDSLTGDPDEIKAHSETWKNVATELGEVCDEMTRLVEADTAQWIGDAADAYRRRSEDTAALITAAKNAADGASQGIATAGEVVAAVRTLVRDIIAELIGHLVSWALQVLATLGIAMAWVLPQVIAEVAKVTARIADITSKLVQAMNKLIPMLTKLSKGFGDASKQLNKIKADGGVGGKPGPTNVRSNPDGPASTKSQNTDYKSDNLNTHTDPPSNNNSGNPPGSTPAPTKLSGTSTGWLGSKVEFDPKDVESIPLKDKNGNTIGVSFPSKPDDASTVTKWAGAKDRASEKAYLKDYKNTTQPDGTSKREYTPEPAPWKDPFYVHAHADPDRFQVTVPSKDWLGRDTKETITVDGATHGKIVSSNQHFQQASAANPNRDVVYMSCSSADPAGNAAKSSSNVVHGLGHQGGVYAPTGMGSRLTAPDGSFSHYGVSPADSGGPGEFKRF